MLIELVFCAARVCVVRIADGGLYDARARYSLYLNEKFHGETTRVVTSLYDLLPDTAYTLSVRKGGVEVGQVEFTTQSESETLNVRDFGAKGDGVSDDTAFLQAAILCCPKRGRVLVPEGVYRFTHLFLNSDLCLELAPNAKLLGIPERERLPVLPERFGQWEGVPAPCYAGLIAGIGVSNVLMCGRGVINGGATADNWWREVKTKRGAWRPRLLFLNDCENITVQGLRFANSPSWNLHPYQSRDLSFLDCHITAPADSPNTDGLDPDSCRNVSIMGMRFSLGDDCIAVKSGKPRADENIPPPCEGVSIAHCLMENGHGGVTIGSEVAGGVRNVYVRDCKFRHTDRGLRVKTRRGRGEAAVIDRIDFSNIRMEGIGTPFVVNSFYFCDADGKSDYVQAREALPVDARTPAVGHLSFRDVECAGCRYAAAVFLGLPEKKIEHILMENIRVSYAEAAPEPPVMACRVEPCAGVGIIAENVQKLTLRNVDLRGVSGDALTARGVDIVEE